MSPGASDKDEDENYMMVFLATIMSLTVISLVRIASKIKLGVVSDRPISDSSNAMISRMHRYFICTTLLTSAIAVVAWSSIIRQFMGAVSGIFFSVFVSCLIETSSTIIVTRLYRSMLEQDHFATKILNSAIPLISLSVFLPIVSYGSLIK
jgi:hypothetical protein